jgi:Ca2+-binding RTX toxin-like protein
MSALAIGSLVATGGALAPPSTASAVASCFDHITNSSRIATVAGTEQADRLVVGQDVVSALGGNDNVQVVDGITRVAACLDAGDDIFKQRTTAFSSNSSFSVRGGAGNDIINAGDGADQLRGDDGNDTIDGRAGNDTIFGGVGNDTLYGAAGNDIIRGDGGDDTIYGEAGDDNLFGGDGSGLIDGGPGIDTCGGGGAYVNCEVL